MLCVWMLVIIVLCSVLIDVNGCVVYVVLVMFGECLKMLLRV